MNVAYEVDPELKESLRKPKAKEVKKVSARK